MILGYRFQLRSTKGWRMPECGLSVARPSRWGCSYSPSLLAQPHWNIAQLAGRPIGCWCALDVDCHADMWLELANTHVIRTALLKIFTPVEADRWLEPTVALIRGGRAAEVADAAQLMIDGPFS